MAEVILRDLEKNDIDVLAKIICETWGFDVSFHEKLAFKMGKLYLAEAISKSNFIKVAVKDGQTAGIITARAESEKVGCFKSQKFFAKCMFPVLFNQETVKALRIYSELEKVNQRLFGRSSGEFDAEIPLFILDENARGFGIGGMLYDAAADFLREKNCKNYYLYTDTLCNYGFYEHKNAVRVAEEELLIPL